MDVYFLSLHRARRKLLFVGIRSGVHDIRLPQRAENHGNWRMGIAIYVELCILNLKLTYTDNLYFIQMFNTLAVIHTWFVSYYFNGRKKKSLCDMIMHLVPALSISIPLCRGEVSPALYGWWLEKCCVNCNPCVGNEFCLEPGMVSSLLGVCKVDKITRDTGSCTVCKECPPESSISPV